MEGGAAGAHPLDIGVELGPSKMRSGRTYADALTGTARYVVMARNPEAAVEELVLGLLSLISGEVDQADRELLLALKADLKLLIDGPWHTAEFHLKQARIQGRTAERRREDIQKARDHFAIVVGIGSIDDVLRVSKALYMIGMCDELLGDTSSAAANFRDAEQAARKAVRVESSKVEQMDFRWYQWSRRTGGVVSMAVATKITRRFSRLQIYRDAAEGIIRSAAAVLDEDAFGPLDLPTQRTTRKDVINAVRAIRWRSGQPPSS